MEEGQPQGDPYEYVYVASRVGGSWSTYNFMPGPIVLELPGTVTDEQLEQTRQNIIDNVLFKDFYNNAILNQWWDNNPNHWLRFQMDKPRDTIVILQITSGGAQTLQH